MDTGEEGGWDEGGPSGIPKNFVLRVVALLTPPHYASTQQFLLSVSSLHWIYSTSTHFEDFLHHGCFASELFSKTESLKVPLLPGLLEGLKVI